MGALTMEIERLNKTIEQNQKEVEKLTKKLEQQKSESEFEYNYLDKNYERIFNKVKKIYENDLLLKSKLKNNKDNKKK